MSNADSFDTTSYVSCDAPIIIGGCGRSGTTLLRVMLDSHHRLYFGPESRLFLREPFDEARLASRFALPVDRVADLRDQALSRANFIELFFRECSRAADKARWGEKTAKNVTALEFIFEVYPNARFLHVIRDGRDVVCSLRNHPRFTVRDGTLLAQTSCNPLDACITRWLADVQAGMRFRGDERYLEIRYEDLATDPSSTIRRVLNHVGEPWDVGCLRHHTFCDRTRNAIYFPESPEALLPVYKSAVGRWQRDFDNEDAAYVNARLHTLLTRLGYG